VGDFTLGWGESLLWDDRAERLYFVDCAAHTLHWLEDGSDAPHTMALPSMPAGIVPAEDGRLVACLDDGLHVVHPDTGTTSFLTTYPPGLGARANDACADFSGNLITGTLNLGPAEGSSWRFSAHDGWKLLDPSISNTNGPNVCVVDGTITLIIGDSSADYYAYAYDAAKGRVRERRVFGDVSGLGGLADGAALDTEGGLWCAIFGGSKLARFTRDGLERTLALPLANPADVAFGGPALDRLYVVSVRLGAPEGTLDGALLVVDGLSLHGRAEPRFALA